MFKELLLILFWFLSNLKHYQGGKKKKKTLQMTQYEDSNQNTSTI